MVEGPGLRKSVGVGREEDGVPERLVRVAGEGDLGLRTLEACRRVG